MSSPHVRKTWRTLCESSESRLVDNGEVRALFNPPMASSDSYRLHGKLTE